MAERGGHGHGLKDFKEKFNDDYLTCHICQKVYTDPSDPQCGHTICRKCLKDSIKTQPDAVRNKVIPCALRCGGTKVPNPSEPVEEWCRQIKAQFIINGLVETFSSKTELPGKKKGKKKKSAKCVDHGKDVNLLCTGCKQVICKKCRSLHHKQCNNVVLIETQFEAMQTYLADHMPKLNRNIERNGVSIATMKSCLDKIVNSKRNSKSKIENHFQKLIAQIRQREEELLNELETVFKSQILDLEERIQWEEMNMQMYQQRLQFIEQTVKSASLIDTCDMYLSLVNDDVEDVDKFKGQSERHRVPKVTFTHDPDALVESLNRLNFGELHITFEKLDVEKKLSVSDRVVSSRKIDLRVDSDEEQPLPIDVTVLVIDGVETLVITDWNNNCVKSFFTRNKRRYHSKLSLDGQPWCISQYKDDRILVAVADTQQIVRVSVRPQLVLLSVINTSKVYGSLAVLGYTSLAAGCSGRSSCVDILHIEGRVMRSIGTHNNTSSLFESPFYICAHPEGHLLVSDNEKKCVLCVTLRGQVVWKYAPIGNRALVLPAGITTTPTGDVLLVDSGSNKIIELSGSGQFVREILTSHDGLDEPMGLYMNKHNSLFVSDRNGQVTQFSPPHAGGDRRCPEELFC